MNEITLNGKTPDIAEENTQKLRQIFPDVFTEDKVDFEKLQQVLGDYVEDSKERYNFTWNGKGQALRLSQTPSLGTLRPCKEESKHWDTTQNLYIEGDNLEVLKLLQKSYHSKVKMIYLDPPYNTGGDFVYPDDFHDSLENYKKITGQVDNEGNRISTNTEASGRYHTDWLNMMYPRLRLARNLLTDDGVIFISIDNNEVHNLRKICDEVFGEENFIDCMIWKKRYGGGAKEKHLVTLQEYVMFYSKSINSIGEIFVPLSKESVERYYSKHDEKYEIRGGYRTHPLEAGKAMDARPNLVYEIIAPDGTSIMPQKQWLWSKERVENAIKNNEIEFTRGKNDKWIVSTKQYLRDEFGEIRKGKAFTIIDNIYTQHGTNEMINIMGDAKIFNYPKPTDFVKELLTIGTGKDSIILDFFSGSATTAHAVMQLNDEDGGNRKFIMVQLPEPTNEKSEAYKAGYMNICEIGKERIRRAGEKIKEEKGLEAQNLDIGFKVLKLDTSNIRKWQPDYDNLEQSILNYTDHYVEGRTELDVVYEIMLKYGLDLTYPVDEFTIANKKVYSIGFGILMICLDNEITTEVAKGILEKVKELAPETTRVVFKDNGFKTDSNKTNIKEILKSGGIEEFITL